MLARGEEEFMDLLNSLVSNLPWDDIRVAQNLETERHWFSLGKYIVNINRNVLIVDPSCRPR